MDSFYKFSVYNRDLTTSEIENIQMYLIKKYMRLIGGITSNNF